MIEEINKEIKFYMNNPCIVIREINEIFSEIQLNTHFAVSIEAEHYCTPSECRSPMSSGEDAQEEYDMAESILEDIQREEHSIICVIENRLLHDEPIEINSFRTLVEQNKALHEELKATKLLHEEWQTAVKSHKNKIDAMKLEIESMEVTIDALNEEKTQSKKGVNNLSLRYNTMLCDIAKYSSNNKQITIGTYNELNRRSQMLFALEKGGVDDWEYYELSLENAGLQDDE